MLEYFGILNSTTGQRMAVCVIREYIQHTPVNGWWFYVIHTNNNESLGVSLCIWYNNTNNYVRHIRHHVSHS